MPAAIAPQSAEFLAARRRVRSCAGRALFRLRAQAALTALGHALQVAAWMLVLFLLADKLFSLRALGINVWTIWGGASALLLPYILWRVFAPQFNERRAAVLADDRLGLHARLSTALALDEAEGATSFGAAFMRECLERVGNVSVQRAFPVRLPRSTVWLALPAALAAGIFGFVQDQDILGISAGIAAKRRAEERQKQASKVLEGKLEDLKKATQKTDDGGAAPKVAQIVQKTADAMKDMKDGKRDPDEALSAMGALKREIAEEQQRLEDGKSFQERLEKISAKDLTLDDGALSKAVSEALKMGDPGLAAREMRKLAQEAKDRILNNPDKSDEQKKLELDKLRGELEKLSGALADDKQLSKDMYELAKSSMNAAEFEKLEKEMQRQLEKQGKGQTKLGEDLVDQAEEVASELERLQEDNDTKLDEKDEAEMEKLDDLEVAMDEAIENLTGEGENKDGQPQNGGAKSGVKQGAAKSGKMGNAGKAMRAKLSKLKKGKGEGGDAKAGAAASGGGKPSEKEGGQFQSAFSGPNNGGPGMGKRPYRDGDAEFETQKAKGEMRAGAITGLTHFRGQGAKSDAPTEFVKALDSAERESSSALDLDRIPADARETVKEYFSGLRKDTNVPAPVPAPEKK
jgi:hypothetical protein